MTQPTLINFYPNKCNQALPYHLFADNSKRCRRSSNTLNNLCNKVCVSNKTEDLNINVLDMITRINESKILTKYFLICNMVKFFQ